MQRTLRVAGRAGLLIVGLVLGGGLGTLVAIRVMGWLLGPCLPRDATDPCDAGVYISLGAGFAFGLPLGALAGAFTGFRVGRRWLGGPLSGAQDSDG